MDEADFLTEVIYAARQYFATSPRQAFYEEVVSATDLRPSELEIYVGIDSEFDRALENLYPEYFDVD